MTLDARGMTVSIYRELINRDLPSRERACESKAVYLSRREAGSRARNSRRTDGSLAPYRCRFCSHWHLGHRRHRHGPGR